MMKKYFSRFVLIGWGLAMTQFYQNCAPTSGFDTFETELSSTAMGDTDAVDSVGAHPLDEKSTVSVRKQHVVSKEYVAGIFREVFTSTKYPISNLDALIDKWVLFKSAQFGGSCNFYSVYSTKDCNGSTANANLPYFTEDNTVRESFRIQLCQNVLGVDAGVNGALEKVGLTIASPVNATNLTLAYGLFYRHGPPETLVLNSLLDLDSTLTAGKADLKERWRAALLQVCESPNWQLF
ncbi:MAG: hypothetical protein J7501_05685 [Bdellovibrio sp.]|nr:hypothetical protein [Bdellovibrio sp.]